MSTPFDSKISWNTCLSSTLIHHGTLPNKIVLFTLSPHFQNTVCFPLFTLRPLRLRVPLFLINIFDSYPSLLHNYLPGLFMPLCHCYIPHSYIVLPPSRFFGILACLNHTSCSSICHSFLPLSVSPSLACSLPVGSHFNVLSIRPHVNYDKNQNDSDYFLFIR